MKKEHLILIAGGLFLAWLVLKDRKKVSEIPIIKPGDKSNAVYGLQATISSITGLQFANKGAYDNDTLNAVKYYLEGSHALVDPEKGYVNENFASDLYIIQSKLKT